MTKKLSIVVPLHNESENIDAFFLRITPILESTGLEHEIICIDDGSSDDTAARIYQHHTQDARVKLLMLSRNFGKEAATSAGLDVAQGDAVIPIDADLQDPPELIPQMIVQWQAGFDVVLATRQSREGESAFKKTTANVFYRFIGRLSTVEIPANTGDFRLIDRKVVNVIRRMPERSRFMKGIFAWPGFRTTTLYFDRAPRHAGSSKWSWFKLWKFALDGIFSFTTAPLKIWLYVGFFISMLSLSYASFLVLRTLFFGADIPGYASLMTAILFMGGIQLLSIGIIGEYVGRIYRESKQRPLYVIDKAYGFK